MDEDDTCLLDVINDPEALGAFLADDQNAAQEDQMETMALSSDSSSKPAYPDFLSMAMAEAELEPTDYTGLDQDPFLGAAVDSAEMGGMPEQRDQGSLGTEEGEDREAAGSPSSPGADGKPRFTAVQRMISQSSQPLHHGALVPDIPTQQVIHYTALDYPVRADDDGGQSNQPSPDQQQLSTQQIIQPVIQQVRLQQQAVQMSAALPVQQQQQQSGLQQITLQQARVGQAGLPTAKIQQAAGLQQQGVGLQQVGQLQTVRQTGSVQTGKQSGLLQTGKQSGPQQTGLVQMHQQNQILQTLQRTAQQQTGVVQTGLQGGLSLQTAQQNGQQTGLLQQTNRQTQLLQTMQRTGVVQTYQQAGLVQAGQAKDIKQKMTIQPAQIQQGGIQAPTVQPAGLQQAGIQPSGLQQVIISQGSGNVQQLVLGSSQIMLSGQTNLLHQGLGAQVLQLGGRQQIRPKMGVVLKQGGGMVSYDGGDGKGLKQLLVLNPQTGVISQVPAGNIQLTGQLTLPQQSTMVGSPQLIIQNTQQTQKSKGTSITTTTTNNSTSAQPVITVAASDGNIIVLRNSAPIFTPASTTTAKKSSAASSVSSSRPSKTPTSVSHSTTTKASSKSKPSKSKTKSKRSTQRQSSSKAALAVMVTSAHLATDHSQTRSVQSLGTIPSIQTSSPLAVTPISSVGIVPPLLSTRSMNDGTVASQLVSTWSMNASTAASQLLSTRSMITSTAASQLLLTSAGGSPFLTRTLPQTTGTLVSSVMTGGIMTTSAVPSSTHAPIISHQASTVRGIITSSAVPSSTPDPIISHQASTVHYRPRQAVPRNQGEKNPGLQQLVQNLQAQGVNERLRSLQELQRLLQQSPQASLQLQELVKSKLGTAEVSMKRPQSVTSPNVTKPPNVYLKPQQLVMSTGMSSGGSFQTTGSKILAGSIPTTGIPLVSHHAASNSNINNAGNPQGITTTSSLQTLSGILSSVATQASVVKEDVATPPLNSSIRTPGDNPSEFNNPPSINLDFLEMRPSAAAASQVIPLNQVLSNRSNVSNSIASSILSTSVSRPTSIPPPPGGITSSADSASIPTSSQQSPLTGNTGSFTSLQSSGSSIGTSRNPFLSVRSPDTSFGEGIITQTSSFVPPTNVTLVPSTTQTQPTFVQMQGVGGTAKTSATNDALRPVLSPVNSAPQPALQASPSGGSAIAGRPSIARAAEQLKLRAQLQLQQIQARVHLLGQKTPRTEQETGQLQQLLVHRSRLIYKVKQQLLQLSQQQKLATLAMVQQLRNRAQDPGQMPPSASPTTSEVGVAPTGSSNTSPLSPPTNAGGAFSSLLVPPAAVNTGSNSGSLAASLAGDLNVQIPQQSPQHHHPQLSPAPLSQMSPAAPLSSPPGSSKQIQNARISSTTSRQQDSPRGEKQKAGGSDHQTERRMASKKAKLTNDSALQLSLSSGAGPGLLKSKLLQDVSQLSKSLPSASTAPGTSTPQEGNQLTKDQLKSQQYNNTMKMLEEKLRSMSPAQQREFIQQYQPLLKKFTQAGQMMMSEKKQESSAGSIPSSVNKANVSQRVSTQGTVVKESPSSATKKRSSASKSSTPTLLQLIAGSSKAETKAKKRGKPPPSKTELLAKQLKKDRSFVTRAEMKKGFKSRSDAVSKLLAFHITQDDSPTEEHLEKFDEEFEDHSVQLLRKKSDMQDKYRYLLLKESMRRGPSAEMVMLDRMVLQDEKQNFEYEKQLSKNPETQNRLLAIIKPNQSKKERFLNAAVAYQTSSAAAATPVTVPTATANQTSITNDRAATPTQPVKQEPSLPPKKRAHIETKPVNVLHLEPKPPKSLEVPIKEPQITKNDFRTKITIKIPKLSSYKPLSPAPSSGDTVHSSLSSPGGLLSPRSDAGSEASSISENSLSPRVRLRRHSTLQALLMSESPLEVNIDKLSGGGKKKAYSLEQSPRSLKGQNSSTPSSPPPLVKSPAALPPNRSQSAKLKKDPAATLGKADRESLNMGRTAPAVSLSNGRSPMDLAGDTGRDSGRSKLDGGPGKTRATKAAKAGGSVDRNKAGMGSERSKAAAMNANNSRASSDKGKVMRIPKGALKNGRRTSVAGGEQAMSVFDFDEDGVGRVAAATASHHPFEPMDVLQDSLEDDLNSTINSILGLQKPSPGDGDHGAVAKGALPSAVFENHSSYGDDDFFDEVATLNRYSYGDMEKIGGESMPAPGNAMASLRDELDIMMEDDG